MIWIIIIMFHCFTTYIYFLVHCANMKGKLKKKMNRSYTKININIILTIPVKYASFLWEISTPYSEWSQYAPFSTQSPLHRSFTWDAGLAKNIQVR